MKASEAKLITDNKAKEWGTYVSYENVIEKINTTLQMRRAMYQCGFHGLLTTEVKDKLMENGFAVGFNPESGVTTISWL